MHKLLPLLLLLILISTRLPGQSTPDYELFGSYIDLNGHLIHEYIDQDYVPGKSLAVTVNSLAEHCPGTYYPPNGVTGKGYTLYLPGDPHFSYQRHKGAEKEIIEPPLSWSFTVGADSFIVANGFKFYDPLALNSEKVVEEPSILQFMGKTQKFSFFKFTNPKKIQGNPRPPNYLVRMDGAQELQTLPLDYSAFIGAAAYIFQDYPELNELIRNKELTQKEFGKIIRFIQYSDALKSKKPILYTRNWDITDDLKKTAFYAKVDLDAHTWRLDFYNRQGEKIFTENYSHQDPVTKAGEAVWYYPESGVIRKKMFFRKNNPEQQIQLFYPSGEVHYFITIKESGQQYYNQVYAPDGKELLNPKGYGSESFYDATTNKTIHREYSRHLLAASWYSNEQDQKIYQLADRNAGIRSLKSLNKRVNTLENFPESDFRAGIDGIVLVKLLVGPDNRIENHTILKGLSPSIDRQVQQFISGLRVKSGKHEKEMVYQEIVLPVHFSVLRQEGTRFNYYHDPFFHQRMHMQHMNNTPSIPGIPR